MKSSNQSAVSPVIGVMLMLVVTIIIAAVVSAFAGGSLGSQQKIPQATIKGVFSQSGGMQIIHTGGDPIPASTLMFTMTSDGTFGQGLSAVSNQIIQKDLITDVNGNVLQNTDGTTSVTSFAPGDTLYISQGNIACTILQPQFGSYVGSSGSTLQNLNWLCYDYSANIGKTFTLTMSDKTSGATIAKTTVVITK